MTRELTESCIELQKMLKAYKKKHKTWKLLKKSTGLNTQQLNGYMSGSMIPLLSTRDIIIREIEKI